MPLRAVLNKLGPGLLFAGAAVGVSHLVYSTQAGAHYGFALVWLVLLANLFKYPFFKFGPLYASVQGESLLEGYRRLGSWALVLFILMTLGTMFTVQAAVTLVTASLVLHLFGLSISLLTCVGLLLVLCTLILWVGRYSLLDKLMKYVILSLTALTLLTLIVAGWNYEGGSTFAQQLPLDTAGFAFVIAFMGWMPAPLDLSVWHSLWALEKKENNTSRTTASALFDFKVGYIGTTILALIFLSLGALIMNPTGKQFSSKATVFSQELIEMYTAVLGTEMGWIVGIAALVTMFSTTITCMDALPRSMAKAQEVLQKTKNPEVVQKASQGPYLAWMLVLNIGAFLLLLLLLTSMKAFLLLATILSFCTAPVFALLNYRLVTKYLPKAQQPSRLMHWWSWLGIAYLLLFCTVYLVRTFL